jgi:hypothetical protein
VRSNDHNINIIDDADVASAFIKSLDDDVNAAAAAATHVESRLHSAEAAAAAAAAGERVHRHNTSLATAALRVQEEERQRAADAAGWRGAAHVAARYNAIDADGSCLLRAQGAGEIACLTHTHPLPLFFPLYLPTTLAEMIDALINPCMHTHSNMPSLHVKFQRRLTERSHTDTHCLETNSGSRG